MSFYKQASEELNLSQSVWTDLSEFRISFKEISFPVFCLLFPEGALYANLSLSWTDGKRKLEVNEENSACVF